MKLLGTILKYLFAALVLALAAVAALAIGLLWNHRNEVDLRPVNPDPIAIAVKTHPVPSSPRKCIST